MTDLVFSHECIILDACCVINLYASKQIEEILTTIPKSVCIAAYVKNEEILKTYDISSNSTKDIDLQLLIDQGVLILVDLNLEIEAETRVSFATVLDDGEAVTGAIALHRNWAIATDDKAAIRLFGREAPHLQIITTPELIKYWVDRTEPPPEVVNRWLQDITVGASYCPSKKHHLYHWWQNYLVTDG
jgi:predicted nucleic acid-binding protein